MIDFNLVPVLPEIFLAISAMGLLMVGAFHGHEVSRVLGWFSVGACFVALFLLTRIEWDSGVVLGGMVALTPFAAVLKLFVLLGLIAAIALSVRYLVQENMARFEYPVLILLSGVGMMLMLSAENMLMLYMGLELQSLPLYVLAAFRRTGLRSSEAGVKYFALGALSSGMLLFGVSLIYGATGALGFDAIGLAAAAAGAPIGLTVGMVFVLAGLAFKISAVPFHMWTPDVYQGAPSSTTALFAIVPKLAAMGLLIKLLFGPFYGLAVEWSQVIYFLSLGSMVVGAFAALVQENIKRLLAYSSIGNIGYALIGVAAASPEGVSATLLYMIIYMFMTAGVFAIVMSMRRGDLMVLQIKDLAGLSQTKPVLAYAMVVLMFSMSGIPPLAGFFGKLAVFQAAMGAEMYVLATLGVLTSVVAAYYYLRIIKVMFFDAPEDSFNDDIPLARHVVLGVSVAFVLFFILKPVWLMDFVEGASASLFLG
jgi:NADH-quinone oxidoreductase subunit N